MPKAWEQDRELGEAPQLADEILALDADHRHKARDRRRAEMRQILLLSVVLVILVVHALLLSQIVTHRICVYQPATHTITCG